MTIQFPDTDSEKEANRILAKGVPGWDKLNKDERTELLRLIRDYRKRGAPAKVQMTRKPDGGWSIEPAGTSEVLALLKLHETFSANSIDPVNARANELLKYLGSVGADNEARYNAALSFIESMKPQDQAEAPLLVQMYCTHDAAIRALSQLGLAEWIPTAQTFGNLATKLLGTSQRQMETLDFVLDALEQAIHARRPNAEDGLIHHSDRGVQYLAMSYTQRLSEADLVPSVGSVGDSYDNALAETINGLYKAEVIWRQRSWPNASAVEMATLRWVDWFNNHRLFGPIGHIPPAGAEANYYAALDNLDMAA